MGASLPLYSVTDMPVTDEITMGLGKSGRNRIDAMIRKGVMPNVAGHPALDVSTGMANGVKRVVPTAQPSSLKTKLLKGGAALAAGAALADSAAKDSTARYAERFGVSEPTGDGSMGDMAKFALLRAGGFASDMGNNLLMGVPGAMFYRDKQADAKSDKTLSDLIVGDAGAAPGAGAAPESVPDVPAEPTAPVMAPIPNPATPEQQQALTNMGITSNVVANHGVGVDMGTAQRIERQGQYGGKGGMVYQLAGMGDQNSVYAKSSRPGGKLNEFYGAGTGKASSPGSLRLNVMSSQGIMAPDNGAAVSAALRDAADRGDWGAVGNYYAQRGETFAGQAPGTANDLRAQLAEVEAMPTNTFGQIAAKRARMAALNKGIQIADMEARNTLATQANALAMSKASQDLEVGNLSLAERRQVSSLKQRIMSEKDQGKRSVLVQELNLLQGKTNDAAGREIVQGENGVFLVDKGTGASMAMQGINPKKSAESRPGVTADGIGGFVISTPDGVYSVNQAGEKKQVFTPQGKGVKPALQNITQADIKATAEKYGISEDEVKRQLGI